MRAAFALFATLAAPATSATPLANVTAVHSSMVQPTPATSTSRIQGSLDVNGPLPFNFKDVFARAVANATGCHPADVALLGAVPLASLLQLPPLLLQTQVGGDIEELTFEAPAKVVDEVEDQAGDPDSPLALGELHNFLVEKDTPPAAEQVQPMRTKVVVQRSSVHYQDPTIRKTTIEYVRGDARSAPMQNEQPSPYTMRRVDVDTAMPYGELEPFGREDTAQELTEQSIIESDEMVDQLERAEVAEEKRAVFRALTRLRGAAITSFDGIARSQTGNIDEYNKLHRWRRTHPLHHLADEESDIAKWAFPDNADF